MKPKIYIAGKLNGMAIDYIKNVHDMIKNAEEVRKAGFSVLVPGINLLLGIVNGDWNYNDYFDNSQPWLEASDGMYIGKWRDSDGTIKEIKNANEWNVPTFFKECNGLYQMKKFYFGKKDYFEPFIIDKPKDLEEYLK
jgi:hypothetical protein